MEALRPFVPQNPAGTFWHCSGGKRPEITDPVRGPKSGDCLGPRVSAPGDRTCRQPTSIKQMSALRGWCSARFGGQQFESLPGALPLEQTRGRGEFPPAYDELWERASRLGEVTARMLRNSEFVGGRSAERVFFSADLHRLRAWVLLAQRGHGMWPPVKGGICELDHCYWRCRLLPQASF